ncbi:hypothetical protein BSKO_12117 [Bryopsis sp. KO-2023]|nr:hypothetical protein BSKO_12117 [Bryopsis sp. KO-2023]
MEKCVSGAALNKRSHIVFDDGFDPTRSYVRLAHDDMTEEEVIKEEPTVPGQVATVILSGGFSRELIDEIDNDRVTNTFDPQSLRGGGKSLMVRGKKHRRIPRGLVKIDESPVVHHWLKTLQQCERLRPLRANVYIVCNEVDRKEFLKTVGFVKEGDEFLAFKRLTATDVRLNGDRGVARVKLGEDAASVPRIRSIKSNMCGTERDVEGVPICLLRKARVEGVFKSQASSLVEMMNDFLESGIPVHGIDLEWGHMHVDSVRWIDYASEFFNYFAQQMRLAKKAENSRCHDDDFVLGDDVCELGKSLRLDRATMAHSIASNLAENPSLEFDRTYFAQQSTKFKGLSRPFYQTPATFYMTAYRRLAGGVLDKNVC